MVRQKEMEESFLRGHRKFMKSLGEAINILEHDITETAEMEKICTGEWCEATEHTLDDLAKVVYSISEPRWLTKDDSKVISEQRHKIHDMYAQYRSMKK